MNTDGLPRLEFSLGRLDFGNEIVELISSHPFVDQIQEIDVILEVFKGHLY